MDLKNNNTHILNDLAGEVLIELSKDKEYEEIVNSYIQKYSQVDETEIRRELGDIITSLIELGAVTKLDR